MAFQSSVNTRKREQTVDQEFFPILGRPGILNVNPNSQFQNYLHGQAFIPAKHPQERHFCRSRQNAIQAQRNQVNNILKPDSPLRLQTSQQCRQQQENGEPGRRRQRLSFSRWHMMISSRYKTELCRQFSEDGDCPFEEKCLFAHGQAEIRPLPRHPKYKTELCRDFHQDGFCSFGPRCNFVHTSTDVAMLSATMRHKSDKNKTDSGNESCDDQSCSGSSVPSTPTPETQDDETFFHFPASLYQEITGDVTETATTHEDTNI